MSNLLLQIAKRIPSSERKIILEERFIEKAINNEIKGTPMEYLFDVYEEFIDATGEYDNWSCFKCREHVLLEFRKIHKYLIQLEDETKQ